MTTLARRHGVVEGPLSLYEAELVARQIGTLTPREVIEMIQILADPRDPDIAAIAPSVRAWTIGLLRHQAGAAEWTWVEQTRPE